MLGTIARYIIGSVDEFSLIKIKLFPPFSSELFFTNDTVLAIALVDSILAGKFYRNQLKDG